MDGLDKIEGLSAEQMEAIKGLHESGIEGLKNKNSELLGKLKTGNEQTASELEAARKAAQEAEEQKLKLEGDMEGLKSHYEKVNAENQAKLTQKNSELESIIKSGVQKDAFNALLAKTVVDPNDAIATAGLSQFIKVDIKDGQAVSKYVSGDKEFDTVSEFVEFGKSDAILSKYIKAVDGQSSSIATASKANAETKLSAKDQRRARIRQKYNLGS